MARTKKVDEVEEELEIVEPTEPTKEGISPLSLDFGRTDLNQLAGKLNEVIEKVNQHG